jgi:hypothetical protein
MVFLILIVEIGQMDFSQKFTELPTRLQSQEPLIKDNGFSSMVMSTPFGLKT